MNDHFIVLRRPQLENALRAGPPQNENPVEGYALVDVLDSEHFEREHIPGALNLPDGRAEDFERRWDVEKKIVVYSGSRECTASRETAERLVQRGFRHVFDYEGGLEDWKQAGNEVAQS